MSVEAYLKWCPTGCCSGSCGACLQESTAWTGGCRWCSKTQSCHNFGSLLNTCAVPINSYGQCQSDKCPYALGEFVSNRPGTAAVWATSTASAALLDLQPYATYDYGSGETGIFDLATGAPLGSAAAGGAAENVVLGAVSDWGSGACETKALAGLVAKDAPHLTFHLADVYYAGTEDEFRTNVLGEPRYEGQEGVAFPKGSHSTFLMCGNHEIIAGNNGLVKQGYKYSGQKASYGAWQSDHWRIIAMDTGYNSYNFFFGGKRNIASENTNAPNPEEVVDWLTNVLHLDNASDTRGIVLLSHHQPLSDWEHAYLGAADQLQKILPAGRTVLWFFGHEHRLALYGKSQLQNTDFYILPRMVGNGGFPETPVDPKRHTTLVAWDNRTYQKWPSDLGGEYRTGFLGYFKLEISGGTINVTYVTGKCKDSDCDQGFDEHEGTVVATEKVDVDLSTGELTQAWTIGPELSTMPLLQAPQGVPVVSSLPLPKETGVLANLNHTSMD